MARRYSVAHSADHSPSSRVKQTEKRCEDKAPAQRSAADVVLVQVIREAPNLEAEVLGHREPSSPEPRGAAVLPT